MKKEGNKSYVKWKGYDNSFNSWIDKKNRSLKSIYRLNICEMSYFPESYGKNKGKIELDLSKYAIKFDLKRATGMIYNNLLKKLIQLA